MGAKALPDALRAEGHTVVLHGDYFHQGISDVAWLTMLRAHRDEWIVLTKDDHIRKNPLEKQAYIESGLRVFALTNAGLSSDRQAAAFRTALRRIIRIAQLPGPYIAIVTASGIVKVIERPRPGRRKKHRTEP